MHTSKAASQLVAATRITNQILVPRFPATP
jgi:hypothetical protein